MSTRAGAIPDEPPDRDDLGEGSASSMAGGDSQTPSALPSQKDQARGFMEQMKSFSNGIEDLARQFPAGAKEFKNATDALKDGSVKVITEMQRAKGGKATAAA